MTSQTTPTPGAVVVAIDESATSRAALVWAARYARALRAELQVVHVLQYDYGPPVAWAPGMLGVPRTISADGISADKRQMHELYAAMFPEASWSLHFLDGPVGHQIVDFARHAQLLVIGTREHRGLERLLVGSVSHYCLANAGCPVVAVPAPTTTTTAGKRDATPLVVTALA